jgi:glycosyltransferase involved in cell wall biosynthesis
MRAGAFVRAAARSRDVRVVVVPVAGEVPGKTARLDTPVAVVGPADAADRKRFAMELLVDRTWRERLARCDPMPRPALLAPPGLAAAVIEAGGVGPGTPVHVLRSYLAPLGLAVAERLGSPTVTLDLDDDEDDGDGPYHRLLATFAPLYSAVSLASAPDAAAAAARYGVRAVPVPNSVEIPESLQPKGPGPPAVSFVGNLTYGPNIEAATILATGIGPALSRAAGRTVPIVLVGPYEPDGPVARLAGPGVTVTGFVPDLAGVYAASGVVVAPLRTGRGTRIKLLEAFAHRVPVVTTAVGAAGLAVEPGEHLLLGDTVEELACAAARLLDDRALADRLAAAAHRVVLANHSPDVVARQVGVLLDGDTT